MWVMFHNIFMEKLTYLDNAATTKMFVEEFDFMKESFLNISVQSFPLPLS